jgi:hypothetical protein
MSTSKTQVTTGAARLSYANVWEAKAAAEGEAPKYSVCVMIPKSDAETVKNVKAAIATALEQNLNSKFGGKKAGLKMPLRDGDELDDDGERVKGKEFEGMWFFNASAKKAPIILDKNREEIIDKTEVYSGVWANVNVNFYAFDAGKSKGIAAGLNAIRKLRDDEDLGGSITVDTARGFFGDVEEDDI